MAGTAAPVAAAPEGPAAPQLTHTAMDVSSGSEPEPELERVAEAAPKPRWFTPLRLLIIFCLANVMVYLDRGARAPMGHLLRWYASYAAELTHAAPPQA
jgi:hypothetical protein